MSDKKAVATIQQIESRIYILRGHKIMLDSDLSWLYGVETRALIQAVKRNSERFPDDFMFQLSQEEFEFLRSQSVISNKKSVEDVGICHMPLQSKELPCYQVFCVAVAR